EHFFNLTADSLAQWRAERGLPKFLPTQLLEWVYRKKVVDPQKMTNISQANRNLLSAQMIFDAGTLIRHQSATDGTQKLLIDWSERQTPVAMEEADSDAQPADPKSFSLI